MLKNSDLLLVVTSIQVIYQQILGPHSLHEQYIFLLVALQDVCR